MKILIIAPHPDDEIIGCGGTILKKIEEGHDVHVIIMGYIGSKIREKESKKVQKKARIKSYTFLKINEPFQYNKKNLGNLIKHIRKINPETIYIPHELERDHDHKVCNELLKEAIWMSSTPIFLKLGKPCKRTKEIFEYCIWTPLVKYNFIQNISKYLDKKLKLINEYKSQIKKIRYDRAVKGLNEYYGILNEIPGGYAEVFNIKWIKK